MKEFLVILFLGTCHLILGQNITDVPICAVRKGVQKVVTAVLTLNSKHVCQMLPPLRPSALESTSNVCVLIQTMSMRCPAACQLPARHQISKASVVAFQARTNADGG
jgi:hypothetical protein